MKKALLLLFLPCLCSCEAHFGNTSFYLPWWAIAIPAAAFVVVVFCLVGKLLSRIKYTCPSCGHSFRPKWWRAAFSVHLDNQQSLKCPWCGKKNLCVRSYDQEE